MNSPHADHARERAERMQAAFDLAYRNSETARARRNRALLMVYVIVSAIIVFVGGFIFLNIRFGLAADVGWIVGWIIVLAALLWIAAARQELR